MKGRVPGTFKHRPPDAREITTDTGNMADVRANLASLGARHITFWQVGMCNAIVCQEPTSAGRLLWHMSISTKTRYPTWDEQKTAKYTIPQLTDIPMIQILPASSEADTDWVNLHDNVMHWWELELRDDG